MGKVADTPGRVVKTISDVSGNLFRSKSIPDIGEGRIQYVKHKSEN